MSLKDARPKRKVAVPIPDGENAYLLVCPQQQHTTASNLIPLSTAGATWDEFLQQVRIKLKILGVGRIVLASSGESVSGLEALDDIDELVVEESNQASASGVVNGLVQK